MPTFLIPRIPGADVPYEDDEDDDEIDVEDVEDEEDEEEKGEQEEDFVGFFEGEYFDVFLWDEEEDDDEKDEEDDDEKLRFCNARFIAALPASVFLLAFFFPCPIIPNTDSFRF